MVKRFRESIGGDEFTGEMKSLKKDIVEFTTYMHNNPVIMSNAVHALTTMSWDMKVVFQRQLEQFSKRNDNNASKVSEFLRILLLFLETLQVYHYRDFQQDEIAISLTTDVEQLNNVFTYWHLHGIRYSTEAVCNGLEFVSRNFSDVLETTLNHGMYLTCSWHKTVEINSWAYADVITVHSADLSTIHTNSSQVVGPSASASHGDSIRSDLKFGVRSQVAACQINCFMNIWDLGVDALLGCPIDSKNNVIAFISGYEHDTFEDFTSAQLIQVQSHMKYKQEALTKFVFSHRMMGYAGFIPIDDKQRIVLAENVNVSGVDQDNPWVVFNAVQTIDRLILLEPSFKRRNYSRDIMKEKLTVCSEIWVDEENYVNEN
jgi:hypothetical protein